MSKPQTINGVPLPTWSDPASITSYLVSFAGLAFAILSMVDPGYTEPAWVPGILGSVGLVIAGGFQIANVIRHAVVTKAAIASGYKVDDPQAA